MESNMDSVDEKNKDVATNKKLFKEMTIKEKCLFIKDIITVEPLIVCYIIPAVLSAPATINLEYEKSCKSSEYFNDTICDAILSGNKKNYSYENQLVQERITNLHSWNQPIHNIVPLIIMIFVGSYSDRHKIRKPFLLIPLIGHIVMTVTAIINVIYMKEISLEAFAILQTLISSMFGGQAMVVVMIFAFIADISTVEMRTLRFGVTHIILGACFPIVQSFSAILFKQIGYIGQFLLAGSIHLIGLSYGILYLKEPREPVPREKSTGLLCDIFDPKHISSTFSLLIKNDSKNNRTFVIMIMILLLFTHGIIAGEMGMFYLYTQLLYNWSVVEYFYFLTFGTVIHLLGSLIAVPICTKVLKLTDYMIIIIGFGDKIISNLILAFSSTTMILYIGTIVSFICTIASIGVRSLATKVVSEDDLGKAQTLFSICEAIGSAIAAPIYNQSYKIMIQTFPGGYFLFGVVIYTLASVLVLFMFFIDKSKTNQQQDSEKNKCDNKESTNDSQLKTTK